MFENNFSFEKKGKETISDELRKLLDSAGVGPTEQEYDFLNGWKKKLLALSDKN